MGVDLRSPEEKLEAAKLKLKMMKSLGANSNKLKAGLFGNRKLNPNLPPTLGKDEGINLPPSHSPEMQEAIDLDEADQRAANPTNFNENGPSILSAIFGARVKAATEKYALEAKRQADRENRQDGLRDYPEWLTEFSKVCVRDRERAQSTQSSFNNTLT